MRTLEELMADHLPDGGASVLGGREEYMEVREIANGAVWMCLEPASRAELDALELKDEFTPVGVGYAAMDAALFTHSPNFPQTPIKQRLIGGRRFICNAEAEAITLPSSPSGMTEIIVNKGHVLGFNAGREIAILRVESGAFVEVIGKSDRDKKLELPEGARIETLTLRAPWVVKLPNPTTTLWWFLGSGGGARGFQGPINLPTTAPEQ